MVDRASAQTILKLGTLFTESAVRRRRCLLEAERAPAPHDILLERPRRAACSQTHCATPARIVCSSGAGTRVGLPLGRWPAANIRALAGWWLSSGRVSDRGLRDEAGPVGVARGLPLLFHDRAAPPSQGRVPGADQAAVGREPPPLRIWRSLSQAPPLIWALPWRSVRFK